MASLMGSRRRAEQFAAVVEDRTPAEQAPADLRALVGMVGALRSIQVPAPRPEFSAALREQLLAEAESALAPASPLVLPPRRRGGRERRLTAAAAVLTLVGGSAGMAVAAQDALPGEALYPIKRGIEDARLGVQSAPEDRGRTYLEQANDRLLEADRLVEEDAATVTVEETVDSFVVQAVAGGDLLLASFEEQQTGEDVQVLRTFTADALERLRTLAEEAPADIQDELARAAVVLLRLDQQAATACADCSDLPSLEMPLLMAQAAEINRAMAAVRTQQPDNNHPSLAVTVPRRVAGGGAGSQVDAPTGPQPGDDDQRSDAPGLGAGVSEDLPRTTREAFKQLDDATGGLLDKVGGIGTDTGETTKQLTDGLTDTFEDTLLGTGLARDKD